jgi:hypothetical protein
VKNPSSLPLARISFWHAFQKRKVTNATGQSLASTRASLVTVVTYPMQSQQLHFPSRLIDCDRILVSLVN